jgi:hypothetical protein
MPVRRSRRKSGMEFARRVRYSIKPQARTPGQDLLTTSRGKTLDQRNGRAVVSAAVCVVSGFALIE